MFTGRYPRDRDDRPSPFRPYPESLALADMERETRKVAVHPPPGVAPFEFTATPNFRQYIGSGSQGSCMGGGSSAALRIAPDWQMIVDVNGCKLLGLKPNLTGDSLSYMTGPRWTPRSSSRWTPHAQVLVGGTKLTQERTDLNCGGSAGGSQTYRQPEQTAPEIYAALRNQRICPRRRNRCGLQAQ